jgi:hypothetical protein
VAGGADAGFPPLDYAFIVLDPTGRIGTRATSRAGGTESSSTM